MTTPNPGNDETPHTPVQVERITLHTAEPFNPERPRRWYVTDVIFNEERARYLIPLSFSPGRDKQPPLLVGTSGKGCFIQRGFKAHRTIERTGGKAPIEYDRIVWKTVQKDCHHPVRGAMIVVVEPCPVYEVERRDDEGKDKVTVLWGGESEPPRVEKFGKMSRAALIADLKDGLAAMKSDPTSKPEDIADQEVFIRELEELERDLAEDCFDVEKVKGPGATDLPVVKDLPPS